MNNELSDPQIEEFYTIVKELEKFETFTNFLDVHRPDLAIVFGRTKRRVDELTSALLSKGYKAEGLHGDITQAKRLEVLKKFKNDQIDILVATDVAARGLDISGVSHVYNFDIPQDTESYTHRIGRTGRAGKEGIAVTFVNPIEMDYIRQIEQTNERQMRALRPPHRKEVLRAREKDIKDKVQNWMERDREPRLERIAEQLLDEYSAIELTAAMLQELVESNDDVEVQLTFEKPLARKRGSKPSRKGGKFDKRNNRYKNKRNNRNYKGRGSDKRDRDRKRTKKGRTFADHKK